MKVIDIVVPNSNEEEFINKAKCLGYDGLVFLYKVKDKNDIKNIEYLKIKPTKLKIFYGAIINSDNTKVVRSLAAELFYRKDLYNDLVLVYAKDFKFNRLVSNIYFINGIVNPGYLETKDKLHYRYIALSTTTFKKIYENKLSIVFSLKDLFENEEYTHTYLGRIIHISKLAKKYKIPIIISSFSRDPEELVDPKILVSFKNLFKVKEPFESVFYKNILKEVSRTRKAKNPYVFTEGFEVVKFPYEDCREF